MHVRMMPAQEPPYTRLIDSARRQPEQTETYVKGSVVGFFTHQNYSMVSGQQDSMYTLRMMIVTLVDMS